MTSLSKTLMTIAACGLMDIAPAQAWMAGTSGSGTGGTPTPGINQMPYYYCAPYIMFVTLRGLIVRGIRLLEYKR
jgi:hypothetical protein